jgi:hypothetical protein
MARLCSAPFKGEVRRGMGFILLTNSVENPIPTPPLPLKGRESTCTYCYFTIK